MTLLFLAALGCTGAGKDSASPADNKPAVLAALAADAAGRYAAFADAAGAAAEATAALCADPTEGTLAAARDGWWAERTPWKQAELIQFGPVVEYPERVGPKLDDWPVNADAVEDLIASDDALDFSAMGSATRGLPVVEYLLWAQGGETLASLTQTPRRCAVAAGASADVRDNAVLLVAAWEDSWQAQLATPAEVDGAYETNQDALDEWVNRMVFTVENVRATKLGKPLGDSSGGEPLPDALESPHSNRSLTDAREALGGVQAAWAGSGAPLSGVRDLVDDASLASQIDALFDAAAQRLSEVPEPLSETIYLQPEIVVRAQEALQALQVALQVDLAQALSVTITFNDNDGD